MQDLKLADRLIRDLVPFQHSQQTAY